MTSATLLADALLATATAVLFGYVGMLMLRRPVPTDDGRRAVRRFAVWWGGLAILTGLGAVRSLLASGGNLDVTTHWALSVLGVFPLVALLWGLVSYLAFIYTGDRRALAAATILHVLIGVFYLGLTVLLRPVAVRAEDWSVPIDYAGGISGGLIAAVLVTLLLPTLVGALAYATLFFRTNDRNARYRIAMTSGAFLFWFGSAGVASVTSLGTWYWWPLAARIIGLVATVMILLAYRPPQWVQARYGLRPLASEAHPAPATPPRLAPLAA